MERLVSAAALASVMLFAACGTAQNGTSAPSQAAPTASIAVAPATGTSPASALPAGNAEPAVAQAQALRIPATSSGKVVLSMTGPKSVTEAKDWASFKEEWRATFADHANERGISFSMQTGEARATGETGTLLNVYVEDYRQVGIGARIFLGIMTGNAYIDAKVAFTDLSGGASFGNQAYNTSSSAWSGVFGKMTPQQVDKIASEVFDSIKPR